MKAKMYLLFMVMLLLLALPTVIWANDPVTPTEKTSGASTTTQPVASTTNSIATDSKNVKKNDSVLEAKIQKIIDKAIEQKPMETNNIWTVLIVSILFFSVMLYLFFKFFNHINRNKQYLGFQSIKLIGLILMFPGICILAIAGNHLIESSTLAALLGTIAGYVLSREDDSKTDATKKENTNLKQEKEALEVKFKEMETKLNNQIEQLKAQLPH